MGPPWTLSELLVLDSSFAVALADTRISYAPAMGSAALRDEIAALFGVERDTIVVTTGASEAMSILFCLAAEPGRNVVLPDMAFPAFASVARAWGLEVKMYTLRRDDGFKLSAETVLDVVDSSTALVLLNTPHNPTGAVVPRAEVERLARALEERRIPLVVDEVYHPLYHGEASPSTAALANVIVVGDMSKALCLPGARTGWIIDRDARRRERALDARSYFTISGSPVLETIATHALQHRDALLTRSRRVTSANLAALRTFMDEHAATLAWVPPQGGTVAFPWFTDGRNSREFCTDLAANGVLTVPGDCFGAPAHLRIGFGAQAEGFNEALEIFARVLR
jgi:aspartate/methionine/tyrosine aminotransferase